MRPWRWWSAALVGLLLLCSCEAQEPSKTSETFCYPPPRRYAGTVVEVSPRRLVLDEGKRGTIYVGFVCEPSVCNQLDGVAKGDQIEVVMGATSVTGSRPFTNKLLHVNKGVLENREMDFEPRPCMGAAEVTAASLMRQKDTAPWPKTGVFAGYYRHQFEVSDFRPAGTSERWWVKGAGHLGFGAMCDMSAPCYLVIRGELSGQGWHGHLGAYNRELRVTEVIEKRDLTPDEKRRSRSRRIEQIGDPLHHVLATCNT